DRGHLRGFASERRDLVAGLRGPLDEEAAGPTGGTKDDDVHGLCLRPYAHVAPQERRAVLGSQRSAEIANLTRGPGARFELASRDPQSPSITRLAHPGRTPPNRGGEYSILLNAIPANRPPIGVVSLTSQAGTQLAARRISAKGRRDRGHRSPTRSCDSQRDGGASQPIRVGGHALGLFRTRTRRATTGGARLGELGDCRTHA